MNNINEIIEEKNLHIKDIDVLELIPNVIDDVIIGNNNDHIEVFIPRDMTGDHYKKWINGKGGIFYKDINKAKLNKQHGKYILLEDDNKKIIARLIEDDELEFFNRIKLVDGKIKDKSYMIIRRMKIDENLTTTDRYIKENEEDIPSDVKIIIPQNLGASDDNQGNSPLFDY